MSVTAGRCLATPNRRKLQWLRSRLGILSSGMSTTTILSATLATISSPRTSGLARAGNRFALNAKSSAEISAKTGGKPHAVVCLFVSERFCHPISVEIGTGWLYMGFKAGFLPAAFLRSFPAPTRRSFDFEAHSGSQKTPPRAIEAKSPRPRRRRKETSRPVSPTHHHSFADPFYPSPSRKISPPSPMRPDPEKRAAGRKPPEKDRSSR